MQQAASTQGDFDEARIIAMLTALGQSTRLSVFRLLMHSEPHGMCVGEIAGTMQCPQNTASGHLAVLARAQLVESSRAGRSVIYRADLSGIRRLIEYLLTDCCHGHPSAYANLLPDIFSVGSMYSQPQTSCDPVYSSHFGA
jgi:DNA-binding transcriptional ArsR family regulator